MTSGIKLIGKSVYITDQNTEGSIKYLNENKIDTIYISLQYYTKDNLDFLSECVNIKKIGIDVYYLSNIKGLYSLQSLKELSIIENDNNIKIDLSYFPKLEILRLDWGSSVSGLSNLENLNLLQLFKYKPKSKDLGELIKLKKLESLILTHGNLTSLNGIQKFNNLKEIQLNYIRNLIDISHLKNLPLLSDLEIENCKKISNIPIVSNISSIERLALLNCGELESLVFIESMENLKNLVFSGTNIKDGNLSYCKNIDYVYFLDKKHYSLKLKDIINNS
ncbi:leucine-rich repeat protein [Bacillus sp. Au-Bac7]|uniref:leucine-rich repeat protein n=1 Tax=Bacillus sp. Au-Bac7 TaxID=2906458 RepID=UPI001E3380AA|nr:leucine-rich repeat protein [Bacillus sp. Au-Bac7]MCE4052215.1 leucine-rich repeat protein [Bacillus sp. Au-Bac7]